MVLHLVHGFLPVYVNRVDAVMPTWIGPVCGAEQEPKRQQ